MRFAIPVLACCLIISGSALSAPIEVSGEEAAQWIHNLVPLPKSISITGKVIIPPEKMAVEVRRGSGPVVEQAVKELREAICATETSADRIFTLALEIGGRDSERLRQLKYFDQAYFVLPGENNKGLRLIALTPRGMYYASKTLCQLIAVRSSPESVEIPIMEVTDWPDIEDRGLWGSDSYLHLRWLADRKMNIVEQIANIGVDGQGQAFARLKNDNGPLVEEGPLYGIKPVPVVLHLEQLGGKGIFQAYPHLKGKSEHQGVICYSQPEFVEILAEWIAQLGSLTHVESVDVWMTENLSQMSGCLCDRCSSTDKSVLEVRAILAAWEKAKERVPSVGLRILTSEETEASNRLVFREVPKEVMVWYYHSLLTYTNRKAPVLWKQYLADFTAAGHWLGVCPNLDATVHWTSPFTGADFVRYRMNEFADKRLSGLIGYATPRVYYSRFNVEAAAEWSWNAKGRSPREFAVSWAVREGIPDPEKFAEWAELVGPVEWAVYGSHWPSGDTRGTPGRAAERLRDGTLPELGFVLWDAFTHPFGDVKSEEHLSQLLANAETAVEIALEMGIPEFIHESLIAQGYINSMKALWELRQIVEPNGVSDEDRQAAHRYFEMYVQGLAQAVEELPKWEACVTQGRRNNNFTAKPVGVMKDMIGQMKEVASELGFQL